MRHTKMKGYSHVVSVIAWQRLYNMTWVRQVTTCSTCKVKGSLIACPWCLLITVERLLSDVCWSSLLFTADSRKAAGGAQNSLSHSVTLSQSLTLTHSHTLSISHSITLDMLNKFCFHLYAQKSLFIGENCNAFFLPPQHPLLWL